MSLVLVLVILGIVLLIVGWAVPMGVFPKRMVMGIGLACILIGVVLLLFALVPSGPGPVVIDR